MSIVLKRIGTKCITLTFGITLLFCISNYGQSLSTKGLLLKYVSEHNSRNLENHAEKAYLQFDKPYYTVGDTIWYKVYLLNDQLTPTTISRIIYVDIVNFENTIVKQYRLQVSHGLAWGDISLIEKEFPPGTYSIRAYTNWMRNFGEEYFFSKIFYITGLNKDSWLISSRTTFNPTKGDVNLKFNDIKGMPYAGLQLRVKVLSGSKNIYSEDLQTNAGGRVKFSFSRPENSLPLSVVAEDRNKNNHVFIPIASPPPDNIDLQFLPEGGNLVAGLRTHIGFKAIRSDGASMNVSGTIMGRLGNEVASFKSLHQGMGSFYLNVEPGEKYSAKVMLADGTVKTYPLPEIKEQGTVMQIINEKDQDSLEVVSSATEDLVKANASFFLVGKARGIICYAAVINFREENVIKKRIAKSLFPQGITHFVIMTTGFQPLNERLVFVDHQDNLRISVVCDKRIYNQEDSVALKIKVVDAKGTPASGSFSFAVTDDAQVKTDISKAENIVSHLLLTSDLRGKVENPEYYFSPEINDSWQAMDNLLLTQGWVGYDWQHVVDSSQVRYQPEKEFAIEGNVLNFLNKPIKATHVQLFSERPSIIMDTLTDSKGRFVFEGFPKLENPTFLLKAVNKNGKSFNVRIKIIDNPPPPFTKSFASAISPWYLNTDTAMLNNAKTAIVAGGLQYVPKGSHNLKEVKITAKKIVKDSQNLNGPGNADQVIDEKELEQAGNKTLLNLFYDKIHGFRESAYGQRNYLWFFVKYKYAIFIIDGVWPKDELGDFNATKRFFEAHSAEEIKGIEINFSGKFNSAYENRFGIYDDINSQHVFIEITTRSGHGPIFDNSPGLYLYKPTPISWAKEFYRPKYSMKDSLNYTLDLRSTIDWEPNIITDNNGEAKVWFYTASKPSTYTITIEGADMAGKVGFKTLKVGVDGPVKKAK